jgi:SpoU rRNA methylase family enzyme
MAARGRCFSELALGNPAQHRYKTAIVIKVCPSLHDIAGKINHCSLLGVRVMVFNATFNNISVLLWRSVLLVEETDYPEKKKLPVASH